jgi:hypothetical protein
VDPDPDSDPDPQHCSRPKGFLKQIDFRFKAEILKRLIYFLKAYKSISVIFVCAPTLKLGY